MAKPSGAGVGGGRSLMGQVMAAVTGLAGGGDADRLITALTRSSPCIRTLSCSMPSTILQEARTKGRS